MKNSIKRAASLLALGAIAASACSINAFAEGDESRFSADGGYSASQIAASAVKPTITATCEVITLAEAKANPTRAVAISVSGADEKYASTGIHFYYDKRLTIGTTRFGTPEVTKGEAMEWLATENPRDDPTAADYDMKGVFVCSAGSINSGLDGVIWTLNLTLPDDAKEGDVFPIDILYRSNATNEDLFLNKEQDEAGKLMMAYTFTQGIYNEKYNPNFKASAEDIAKCEALADIAGHVDGYIAIADGEKPTEPPTTEPATQAPTTEPATQAPTTEPATQASTEAGTQASTAAGTQASTAAPKATTTAKATTKAPTTTAKKDDSPKTGVAGVGVVVAGLAAAIGTAFVFRKKED